MEIFEDDEAGYLAWIGSNPMGLVANVDKAGQIGSYPMVHLATHGTIASPKLKNFTTGRYLKACATSFPELQQWSVSTYGRPLAWCATCSRWNAGHVTGAVHTNADAVSESDGWSDDELRASVVTYLTMREKIQAGETCVKKHYYEVLAEQFDRTSKAFEFRMQNISYVLALMGRQQIPGLLPARNVGVNIGAKIEALVAEIEGKQVVPVAALSIATREASKRLKGVPTGNSKPAATTSSVTQYVRDPEVRAWVLREAKGVCECCLQPAPFETADGPFLEVHHVQLLAEKGSDTVCNAIAICPNCHRRLHYALDSVELIGMVYSKIGRLKREPVVSFQEDFDDV